MSLTKEEKNRYSRQIQLNEIGVDGQEKLKKAKVLVIGAGGLGCPVLQYLAAAGIGAIGVIDFDLVEESNLHRQILFNSSLIGINKAIAAKEQLEKLNPFVTITAYPKKLDYQNAVSLFKDYDLIIDGTDNFATRYLVNDASLLAGKPFVYGAIHRFEGQVAVFNYKNGPTYRCLFPTPPKANTIPNCSESGVLGVLPGIIGTYQANEALKMILGIGETLSGKLMLINTQNNSTTLIKVDRIDAAIKKQLAMSISPDNYIIDCETTASVREITVEELKEKLASNEAIQFIDVRELNELPQIAELSGLKIPSKQISDSYAKISKNKTVVIYCQTGKRSKRAVSFLQEELDFNTLWNLQGGIESWLNSESNKVNLIKETI